MKKPKLLGNILNCPKRGSSNKQPGRTSRLRDLDLRTALSVAKEGSHAFPPLLSTIACIEELVKTTYRIRKVRKDSNALDERILGILQTLDNLKQKHRMSPHLEETLQEFNNSLTAINKNVHESLIRQPRLRRILHLSKHEEIFTYLQGELENSHTQFMDKLAVLTAVQVEYELPNQLHDMQGIMENHNDRNSQRFDILEVQIRLLQQLISDTHPDGSPRPIYLFDIVHFAALSAVLFNSTLLNDGFRARSCVEVIGSLGLPEKADLQASYRHNFHPSLEG